MANKVLDKIERINHYKQTLKECQQGGCLIPKDVEHTFAIGNYKIARLQYLDDIYNHAYVEDNYNFIIDEEGIPYPICKTESGNTRHYSEEIKTNDELVDDLTNALIFIDYSKKLPYSLKYGKQGKELEASLKNGLETGDFSKVSLNNYLRFDKINQMREKYISKLNVYQKRDFRSAASARSYKTREELSSSLNEEKTK